MVLLEQSPLSKKVNSALNVKNFIAKHFMIGLNHITISSFWRLDSDGKN
jgi:hypothetical protein